MVVPLATDAAIQVLHFSHDTMQCLINLTNNSSVMIVRSHRRIIILDIFIYSLVDIDFNKSLLISLFKNHDLLTLFDTIVIHYLVQYIIHLSFLNFQIVTLY